MVKIRSFEYQGESRTRRAGVASIFSAKYPSHFGHPLLNFRADNNNITSRRTSSYHIAMPQQSSKIKPLQSHCVIRLSLLALVSLAVFLQISVSIKDVFYDEDGAALSFAEPIAVKEKDQEKRLGSNVLENTTRITDNSSPRQQEAPPNAMHLWTSHADQIIAASQHPKYDPQFKLYNVTRDIFHTITPRLDLAIRALPLYNHEQMTIIMEKLNQRRDFLRQGYATSSSLPPPLKLLVMGGSVARGLMCNTGLPGYMDDACSWVTRLDLLLNYDYDNGERYNLPLVEIKSTAIGGWNTYVSNAVLEYDLIEDDDWLQPDIILNAHSTNEMHVNTVQAAEARNVSHFDHVFQMTQDFIRTVLKKCMAGDDNLNLVNVPPLLIYFDDYLGNDQRSILETTTASQATHILAKYYGIGYVSYADVVRDIVLRNTKEEVFSPNQWYKKEHGDTMLREVHPNFGMHIASSMVLSYYLLTLQANHEGMQDYHGHHQGEGALQFTPLKTQDDPSLLPPTLDRGLLLDEVSEKYPQGERRVCGANAHIRHCPVSWLIEASSGANSVNATMDYFRPYMLQDDPQEWEWYNQGGRKRPRFGFTPVLEQDKKLKGHEGPGTNRTMTFTFDYRKEQRKIRSVTVFYLQKNQTKWKGTEISVSVRSMENQKVVAHTKVSNYHETIIKDDKVKTTIALDPPQQHFKVEFKHTGGVTFRMTGFSICE